MTREEGRSEEVVGEERGSWAKDRRGKGGGSKRRKKKRERKTEMREI